MSMQRGNPKKQGQKYQNAFKFKHNMTSKKTVKLLATPLDNLCQRCFSNIEWKIQFHKYKPLKQFQRCNDCNNKTVDTAYRQLCTLCARTKISTPVEKSTGEPISMHAVIQEVQDKEKQSHDDAITNNETQSLQQEIPSKASEDNQNDASDQENDDEEEKKDSVTQPKDFDIANVLDMTRFEFREMRRCSKCTQAVVRYAQKSATSCLTAESTLTEEQEDKNMTALLSECRIRQKRALTRKIEKGLIKYDAGKNCFIYCNGDKEDEEVQLIKNAGNEEDSDDMYGSEGEDSDEDQKGEEKKQSASKAKNAKKEIDSDDSDC